MGRNPSAKWIAIEDLAERRRAQNRLAQRKRRINKQRASQIVISPSEPSGSRDTSIISEPSEAPSTKVGSEIPSHENFLDFTASFTSRSHIVTGDFRPSSNTSELPTSSQLWSLGQGSENTSQPTSYSEIWEPGIPGPPGTSDRSISAAALEKWIETSGSQSNVHPRLRSLENTPATLETRPTSSSQTVPISTNTTPLPHAPLEQRIQHVVNAGRAAGFDSLDSMILRYYTASFPDSAPLAEMQHRSRRRGIPQLLSGISNQARSWPRREAQCFEEILTSLIEEVVRHEARDHGERDRQERNSDATLSRIAVPLRSTAAARDEVPITWSILYETAAAYLSSETDRSNFVREAINELMPNR